MMSTRTSKLWLRRHLVPIVSLLAVLVGAAIVAVNLAGHAEASPGFYVGNLIYKEQVLESKGKSAAACKRGPFEPVSEKSNRLIYTSRRGGGWY